MFAGALSATPAGDKKFFPLLRKPRANLHQNSLSNSNCNVTKYKQLLVAREYLKDSEAYLINT